MGWLLRGGEDCRADEQGPSGVEGDSLAFDLGGGVVKSKVSHRAQASRQDVAQVASDELAAG